MRLTTKGRYAVTAMLDLALHEGKGPISLADISERQGISLSFLYPPVSHRTLDSTILGAEYGRNF